MRFEVSYSTGTTHEVTLAGSLAVLGRDPGCDIVLNDTKCSRRHAVVEDTAQGLVVRDTGSANGVYLNERRVERSVLKPGDTIRLGDVRLRLLAEIGETVIVAFDEVPPASSPAQSQPAPAPASSPVVPQAVPRLRIEATGPQAPLPVASPPSRPLTVSVLSVLWALSGLIASGAIATATWRLEAGRAAWGVAAVLGLLLIALGLTISLGLRALAPWARHLAITGAYLGLVVCPFAPAAATVLLYLNRSDVRRAFAPGRIGSGAGSAESTFALSIVAMILVGLAFAAIVAFLAWPAR